MCPPTYHQQSIIQLVVKTVLTKKETGGVMYYTTLFSFVDHYFSCRRIIHRWSSGLTETPMAGIGWFAKKEGKERKREGEEM